jgi:hypothetical protein
LIEKITFTNFRGIRNGDMELSPITILLGPNNSAKSTILEAIFLAPNPCRNVPYIITLEKTGGRETSSALDVVYFLHQTLDYQGYTFLLNNYTAKSAEIKLNRTHAEEYSLRFILAGSRIYLTTSGAPKETSMGNVAIGDKVIPYFASIYADRIGVENLYSDQPFVEEALLISPKLLKSSYEYLRKQWTTVVNSRIARKVAMDTSKFSMENYKDFTMEPVLGGHVDIHAYLDDGRRIRLGDLGEGVQSYAMTRILYELTSPKVLLWDDLESHLNPRILACVADWFSELINDGRQIVLSTHSLDAAKAIAGVNEENTRICLTSLAESALKTKKLTLNELEDFQKAGIDARTAEAFML